MSARQKLERRFLDAVKRSPLVSSADLEHAIEFQKYARRQGRDLPIDRILTRFGYLEMAQAEMLYDKIRFKAWRKEDKFYLKVAAQSKILSRKEADVCLAEQKSERKRGRTRRVNEIAVAHGFISPKEDRALIKELRKIRSLTIEEVPEGTVARSAASGAAHAAGRPADTGPNSEGQLSDEDLEALWEEAELDDIDIENGSRRLTADPLFDSDDDFDL